VLVLALSVSGCSQEQLNTDKELYKASHIADQKQPDRSPLPDQALANRLLLLKWTISFFGDETMLNTFAAQIHQESLWCKYNVSRVGAYGCAQFMPKTAAWAISTPNGIPCRVYEDFLDPTCALPALVWLNRFNYVRSPDKTLCDQTAFMLSKYNGGGVKADREAAEAAGHDPDLWFGHVELFNGRHRAEINFRENRQYPHKILRILAFTYKDGGYGDIVVCNP
jgi:hypothetical protein